MVRKILILTASPEDAQRLRNDQEMQAIQDRLQGNRSGRRKNKRQFEITFKCARPGSLLDDIEDKMPEIIHFGGHGTERGLVLENASGAAHLVNNEALRKLFKRVGKNTKCVLLNACDSRVLAESISEYVPYVIGMQGRILDQAAIAFAGGFYRALGDGESIESAFERGSISAHCFDENEIPELFKRSSPKSFDNVRLRTQNFLYVISRSLRNKRGLLLWIGLAVAIAILAVFVPPRPTDSNPSRISVSPCSDPVGQIQEQDVKSAPSLKEKGLASSGERILLDSSEKNLSEGAKAFAEAEQSNQSYALAISFFKKAVEADKNNPEPYIYLYNAQARQQTNEQGQRLYALAAAIPATDGFKGYRSEEVLRGIVDAQACFNGKTSDCSNSPHNSLLEVRLFDDANDPDEIVAKVAKEISENEKIVGVIGHYSSRATKTALRYYEGNNRIGVVSPTATSSDVKSEVFFRTVASSQVYAKKIFEYMKRNGALTSKWNYGGKLFNRIRRDKAKQVVGFRDSSDDYSSNQWIEIKKLLQQNGISPVEIELKDSLDTIDSYQPSNNYAFVLIPPSTLTTNFTSEKEFEGVIAQLAKKLSSRAENGSLFIGGSSLYSSTTFTTTEKGAEFEDMVLIAPWFFQASEETRDYAQKASDKWGGQINWVTASSYDATRVFTSVLASMDENVSEEELREKVISSLASVKLSLLQASGRPLQFNEDNESDNEPLLVKVVRGRDCSPSKDGYAFQLLPD